ncbi:glycosyltransferase [Paenibacillus sp. TAF43_2]|uniref:glycosyltransferase n=1 Tax=Paenibacillus sp. TAF43_2 TaxID=3233069 RepID=UPI003F97D7F4
MNPKVSIIVPIFNMELYLDRCLNSLLEQSLSDIEIIAVNDGSTDSSLSILQEYTERDSRIIVINKKNEGVSAARNDGVLAANGEYIGFVDPDDWVNLKMYEEMYACAVEQNVDIVMCTYIREFGTHSKEKRFNMPDKQLYLMDEVQTTMLRRLVGPLKEEVANPEYLDAWGTVWSKLYRTSLLKDNKVKFKDLSIIGSNEDTLFNIHVFYNAESFLFLNRPFYHYWRTNDASITSQYNPLLVEKFEKLYAAIQSFLTEKGLINDFGLALNNRISMNVLGQGLNIMNHQSNLSMRERLRLIKKLLNNEKTSYSLRRFQLEYCPLIWKTFFLCAKLKISSAIYFMLLGMNWIRRKNTGGIRLGTENG